MGRWYSLILLAGVAAAIVAAIFYYGQQQYNDGQRDLLVDIEQARAASVAEKMEIDDEISALTPSELRDRALGWVRRQDP